MIDDYDILINDCVDITKTFDKSIITLDNIIIRQIIRKNNHNTFEYKKSDYKFNFYIGYSFVYNNDYYVLVLKDIFMHSNLYNMYQYRWEKYIDMDWHNDRDMNLIHNITKVYKIYKFNLSWFKSEKNTDELCELEMIKIIPIIRKEKIRKILI